MTENLVAFMLYVNGFEVHDLGVDVEPQAFVDKINEIEPDMFLRDVHKKINVFAALLQH